MKKSQVLGTPTTYVLIVIIVAVIIFFGIFSIRQLTDSNREAQVANFVFSLQNKLRTSRTNLDSVSQETFALPTNIETVCFVDAEAEQFMPFVNKKLSEEKASFSEHNLFMEPFGKYSHHKLDYLYLPESENPLCVNVVRGKLSLSLEGHGNKTRISAADVGLKDMECVSVLYNNMPGNSLDIVFLGYDYGSVEAFSDDVDKYVNDVLFEIEPFKSSKDKINVYRVDVPKAADLKLDCAVGSWVKCDSYKTNQIASNCPHDYTIILVNLLDQYIRSSAVGDLAKINTAPFVDKFVVAHELGHIIGGLADEYTDAYYETIAFDPDDYPNCDKRPNECDDWAAITDGCYPGCTKSAYYRSTETSIMRDLDVHDFGPVNENAFIEVFDKYDVENE